MEIYEQLHQSTTGNARLQRYKSLQFLGQGQYGKVQRVQRLQDNKIFALKMISTNQNIRKDNTAKLRRQIQIQKSLDHPHICKLYSTFIQETYQCLVLQYCQGTTLDIMFQQGLAFEENLCKKIFWQLVQAVQYLHANRIIHRDLKPSNIIINSEKQIKIIDFGLATKVQKMGQKKKSLCGTPAYVAPQIAKILTNKKSENDGYGYEIDIWALGIILHMMLTAELPFKVTSRKECIKIIAAGKIKMAKTLSSQATDLLAKILISNPTKRISLNDIKEHPFLRTQRRQVQILSKWKSQKILRINQCSSKDQHKFQSLEHKKKQPQSKKSILSAAQLKLKFMLGKLTNQRYFQPRNRKDLEIETSIQTLNQDILYISSISIGQVCAYTMNNGYQGSYESNAQINLLYNNHDFQYFAIKKNQSKVIKIDKNMSIKEGIAKHFKAIACNASENSKKCQFDSKINKLIYLQKMYDIKAESSYLLMLSNQTYQLINHKKTQTIIFDPKQNNVTYLNLSDICNSKKTVPIQSIQHNPNIKKMFLTLSTALKKLNKTQ